MLEDPTNDKLTWSPDATDEWWEPVNDKLTWSPDATDEWWEPVRAEAPGEGGGKYVIACCQG